ncbi:alpha/beta hydrolase [Embleya sp. NPDC008237]|uniref:alpha/beta hydrolase n=1 Tax=Embleya sp. NPDC008237 TaxID=3363978 RepID=UPI0036E35B24
MVNFVELRDARFDGWREFATAWTKGASRLHDLERSFRTGVNDIVEEAGWKGVSAQTADKELERLVRQISISAMQARSIGSAADKAIAEILGIQASLLAAIRDAEASGIRVTDASGGYVLKAEVPPGKEGAAAPDPARVQGLLDEYKARFDGILRQASEADDKIAGILATLNPSDVSPTAPNSWENATEDARRVAGLYGLSALPEKMDPVRSAAWWRDLSEDQRKLYLANYPHEIGSMDGLPAADRDKANRIALDARLADLSGRPLTDKEYREIKNLEAINLALTKNGTCAADDSGIMLLKFGDKFLDGQVVMSIGNPDLAKNTAILVPGTNTDVAGGLEGQMKRLDKIQEASDRLTLERGDVASVFWLDYDAPEASFGGLTTPWESKVSSVVGWGRSEEGAPRLDSFVGGLRAQSTDHHISVVAHSYGSALLGDAGRSGDGIAVDDMIVVGSPGMHADSADDLHIDPRHVWAEVAGDDPIPGLGEASHAGWQAGHGKTLPHETDFGGNRLAASQGDHSSYWNVKGDEADESLKNQAKVIMGTYDDPNPARRPELVHGQYPTTPKR